MTVLELENKLEKTDYKRTRQTLTRYVNKGMPLDSVAGAKKWIDENVSHKHNPKNSGKKISATQIKEMLDEASDDLESSDEAVLNRIVKNEMVVSQLIEGAISSGDTILIKSLTSVHNEILKSRNKMKADLIEVKKLEGELVEWVKVQDIHNRVFGGLRDFIKDMPKVYAPIFADATSETEREVALFNIGKELEQRIKELC